MTFVVKVVAKAINPVAFIGILWMITAAERQKARAGPLGVWDLLSSYVKMSASLYASCWLSRAVFDRHCIPRTTDASYLETTDQVLGRCTKPVE